MSTYADELRGRAAELALLGERLHATKAGRGGVAIVTGEAGIGKSALMEVLTAEAEKLQFAVLTGRAWEFADAPAYFPVKSGLRALGVTFAKPASSDVDAFGFWEDVLEALARACAGRPVFWLIEDLHAADAQTIELLAFLAQPLRAISVLIVVTVRTGDVRATGAVLQRLMRLIRGSDTIQLANLREEDVAAVVARVAGRALPAGSVDAWMARTGGNPLFVVECARAVRAGRSVESALPETVVEVVVERLRLLPVETRGLLQQGALLGREFTAASVARLLDRLPAAVIDGLLPTLRAGLLEEMAPGRFRFGHALVRDAIEEAIPAAERRASHARIEAELAEHGETATILTERARHAIAGLGALSEEYAGQVVVRAVAALETEGARDRAFGLWRRWIDTRTSKSDAVALLDLSRLATAAGNHSEAQRAAEAASALAKLANDPLRTAQAALALGANPRPGVVDSAHVRVLEDALARLPVADEPRLACLLRARLAAAMQPSEDPTVPLAMAREALAAARARGDDALLREVLVLAGSALTYFVDATETQALALELLALSLGSGDNPRALRAFTRCIVGHLELGDFAAFDKDSERMFELVRATGHPSLTWRPLIVGSMRALARGNFAESERLITEVEEMSGLIDDPAMTFSLRAHKLYRTLAIDDESEIRAALMTVVPQLSRVAGSFGTTIRSLFAVRLHDRTAVADEIPALLQLASKAPPDSPLLGVVGEAVALAGTADQRAALFAQLLPLDGRELHTAPIPHTYEGPVSRVLGLLEASLGRIDAADARLEASRERCRTMGLRPWVARLSLERAKVLLMANRTGEARSLLEEAATIAAELNMSGIGTSARRAIDGDRMASASMPSAAPRGAVASLTLVQEGEVWRVTWATSIVRVRDSRGVQLLAKVVASPGERMHVLALAGEGDATLPESDAGVAIDQKAIAAYRARLTKIDDTLAAAEAKPDGRHADQLRRERDLLVAEISRAVGLGGRLRKIGSATERARINVTRRLRDAIARISEAAPPLGRHLEAEIRTGTYCSYRGKS